MSDFQSHHELDDELLSAYLDDELSPEERAAVEARLAADPAAEQLLHQLRAVSQAVQSLPQEVVEYDLQDSVLRKVEQQSQARTKATAAAAVPAISIGRTRRGWVWASLAVAAGLLIMVLQSDTEQNNDLPAVAQRDAAVERESVRRGREGGDAVAFRELREPAAPAAAPLAAGDESATVEPESQNWGFPHYSVSGGLGVSQNEAAPADGSTIGRGMEPTGTPLAQLNQPANALDVQSRLDADSDAAAPGRSSPETFGGEAAGTEASESFAVVPLAAKQPSEINSTLRDLPALSKQAAVTDGEPATGSQLLVVRVVARRAALEGKAFDQLLERNGIQLEGDTAPARLDARRAYRSVDRFAQQDKSELDLSAVREGDRLRENDLASDAVLVKAEPDAIMSCLESLHNDTANYVAVDVDDATAIADRLFDAAATVDYSIDMKDASNKQLAEQLGWTKYNRGLVPREEESRARAKLHLYYSDTEDYRYRADQERGQTRRAANIPESLEETKDADTYGIKKGGKWSRGQAQRVRALTLDDSRRGEAALGRRGGIAPQGQTAAGEQPIQLGELRQQLSAAASPESSETTLPVLFLLTPADEPAPSPATNNRAE